tara:strand:+ start:142736 stop:143263 length:528 start_codon:yes stop_codon:yes gene_type:complete
MKLIILFFILSFNSYGEGSLIWKSQCENFDEDSFNRALKKKCLDKKCKIQVSNSSKMGLSGKTKNYQFKVLPSRKTIETTFKDNRSLGLWSQVVTMFCPDLEASRFAKMKVTCLPNRKICDVYHLDKKSFKNHSFYKDFHKSPDPCVKLEIKKSKKAVIMYLVPTKKSKVCFPKI